MLKNLISVILKKKSLDKETSLSAPLQIKGILHTPLGQSFTIWDKISPTGVNLPKKDFSKELIKQQKSATFVNCKPERFHSDYEPKNS